MINLRAAVLTGVLALSGFGLAVPAVHASPVATRCPEGQMCAGFAGLPCPEGYACLDDPRDSCDPAAGGADCSGVCVPEAQAGSRHPYRGVLPGFDDYPVLPKRSGIHIGISL
ncbi:hypothetical protein AB0J38_07340 [Streptomyces sp. NPDC050095]|uniref:hypothetical protein n=1 Tax=unclassified Streptomyces TaxID=2593676 RepID=UPI003446DB90